MKPNKDGKYRVNFYLNPDNMKDKVIIEYLNQRYSANDYIKETLYNLAYGIEIPQVRTTFKAEDKITKHEEYEKIEELDEIEI